MVQSYTNTEFPLSPSYTHLTFLIQFTSSLGSWRNQRRAQPRVIFHRQIQKSNLWIRKTCVCTPCSFLYYSHTHTYFLFSITTSIILRSAFELTHAIHPENRGRRPKRRQRSRAALLPRGQWALHCSSRVTVKVTAGWHPAGVGIEQVGTVKAGKGSFFFLYSRRFIFAKCLGLFTMLTWSLVTDLFTGQKQDCTQLQNPKNLSCRQTPF